MPQGSYGEYDERMRSPDAWGSILEPIALAKCTRTNLIIFSEGKRKPEYIPGMMQPDTFEKFPTGIIGFQNEHFVWYRYDWRAETGGDVGAMEMAETTPGAGTARRGGAHGSRRKLGRGRVRKGLKQKERNRLTHAKNGNTTSNLERAWNVATRLNVNQRPHPHQAAVAVGAEAPNEKVLPPEEWVTRILPMVVVAELSDVGKAPKVNLKGDIVGIIAHTGRRRGIFYGVQGGKMGNAVYGNWAETLKNTRKVSRVRFMKFAEEREARAFAGLQNNEFVRVAVRVYSPMRGALREETTTMDIAAHVWERDVMKHFDKRPDGTALKVVFFGVQKGGDGDQAALKVAGEPAVDDAVLPTKGWRCAFGDGADRQAGVSLYAGTGGMEVVHEDVGIPNAVTCDNDRAVLRNRKNGGSCLKLEITDLGEWHRIVDALDEFARERGWSDWGNLRLHMGLPCQPWSTAFTDPPGLSDARGWHFVHMLRLMVWLQPIAALVETGEAIMGTHVAVWWLIVLLAELNGFTGRGQITNAADVAAQARRRAYGGFWRRDVWDAACRVDTNMVRGFCCRGRWREPEPG